MPDRARARSRQVSNRKLKPSRGPLGHSREWWRRAASPSSAALLCRGWLVADLTAIRISTCTRARESSGDLFGFACAWPCRCCSGRCSRGVFSARRGDAVVERRAMVDGIRHADRYWMPAGVNLLDATRARPAVGSRWYTASTVGARLSHRTRLCGRDSTFCDARRISWNGVDLRIRSGANTHRPFASGLRA